MNPFTASAATVSRGVVVAAACFCMVLATVPAAAQSKKESKEAAKFRSQAEQARGSIENARDQLQKTVGAYDALLGASEKKMAGAHKKLSQEVTKTEKAVEDAGKHVTAFRETAEKFFATWEQGVSEITTESIRKASQRRYDAALTGFENMYHNLGAAREAYAPLIGSLKEQILLLGQDLTTDTVTMLREEVAPDLHAQAENVFASIEQSLSKEKANEDEVHQVLAEEQAETGDEVMDGDAEEQE
jgi:hypothetical protein